MGRKNRQAMLIALNVCVWAAALTVLAHRQELTARAPATIHLSTSPAAVRLTIDGRKHANGAWLLTPVEVQVPPGSHRLKVARDGYKAQIFNLEASSGSAYRMEDVVLEPDPDLPTTTVEVSVAKATEPAVQIDGVHVDLDNGYEAGLTPLTVPQVAAGQAHTLAVFPAWPALEPRFQCRFTPTAGAGAPSPYLIRLTVSGHRVTATGCDRVKSKNP